MFHYPHVVVDGGTLTVEVDATKSTVSGDLGRDMLDGVTFKSLKVTDTKKKSPRGGKLILHTNLEVVDVKGDMVLDTKSTVTMAQTSTSDSTRVQMFKVRGDYMQGGENTKFQANGQHVMVHGDHIQAMLGADGTDMGMYGTFDLSTKAKWKTGREDVYGDFMVGMGFQETVLPEDSMNTYIFGKDWPQKAVCGGKDTGLTVMGDYYFNGAGDVNKDAANTEESQGMRGMVTFMAAGLQNVWHGSDGSQKFCNVTMNNSINGDSTGIRLMTDAMQGADATLTLKKGRVYSDGHTWSVLNENIEENLVGRNSAGEDSAAVFHLGSRNSYISGRVERVVSMGNAGGGLVTGGYLFPVGTHPTEGEDRQVHHFRPLILQFPDDLGGTSTAGVEYLPGMDGDDVDFPAAGIVVNAVGGGTLTLDNVGPQFWKVTFDEIPAFDPNLRIAAEGLPNVFDVHGLRIIQWDCDFTSPRLAGTYDVDEGAYDDESILVNDFINGVLNLTQEGVPVEECSVFGVASNLLENPISLPPIEGGIASVQFIHNVVDAEVDVYVDDNRIINDWTFRSATGFVPMAGGEHTIDLVLADAEDNSSPVLSHTVQLTHEETYTLIAHGDDTGAEMVLVDDTRQEASAEGVVEFFFVHGAKDLGSVDIRLLDPINNTDVLELLANNLEFTDVGTYLSLEPGGYNLEVTTSDNSEQIAVWRMELQQYRDEALVLNLSGPGKDGSEGVGVLGVEVDGSTFILDEITATEGEELPEEFALNGNYPNPFNPSTRIEFDLPETARVSIQIIDMLGRTVLTLPAKELEAGAKRTIEVNAAKLASGTYLYRLTAISASETNIDTGKMLLIK